MTWELATDLARHVGNVSLLTGHPDTLAKGSRDHVNLVPATAYRRGRLPVRFWSWLRYSIQAFFWLWKYPRRTPILVFSNPPIALWVVRLIHLIRGTPYAVMVHDIFPDVLVRKKVMSHRHVVVRIWNGLNRRGYESAELVMTLGKYMARTVGRQFDASQTTAGRVRIVPPWSDGDLLRPIPKPENPFAREHGQVDKWTFMYSGNMGLGHDLESMLQAAERMADWDNCHFMFIGAGPKWALIEKFQRQKRLANVTLLGWQPEGVLPFSLATADVALVSLEPEMSGLAVPSKAFYFLAAGVPLIAVCDEETELAVLIREFGCGVVVPPGSPSEIEHALRSLRENRAKLDAWQHGAQEAMQSFPRRQITDDFTKLLSDYLGTPFCPPPLARHAGHESAEVVHNGA